jgi:hypothetical protein
MPMPPRPGGVAMATMVSCTLRLISSTSATHPQSANTAQVWDARLRGNGKPDWWHVGMTTYGLVPLAAGAARASAIVAATTAAAVIPASKSASSAAA